MKNLDTWLTEYQESHQNEMNSKIHIICVPAIMFTIVGLLYTLLPNFYLIVPLGLSLFFYLKLSTRVFLIMLILLLGMFFIAGLLHHQGLGVQVYLFVFILAWIGQFIGHKIEGKKPSFFKDLQFLLIGPLWILRKFKLL